MVDYYVSDVYRSLENKCWFSALAMSLALPDICGAAEYPNETSVAKRYISWYDKYVEIFTNDCNAPFLSGEVVYNLRNTFLHNGSPNINSKKVKDEANQLDKFMLVLGDDAKFWSVAMFVDTPIVKYRIMAIDVTFLCKKICESALWYYNQNKEKFHFDFYINTHENLLSPDNEPISSKQIINVLNKKLELSGDTKRFQDLQDDIPRTCIIWDCTKINLFTDQSCDQWHDLLQLCEADDCINYLNASGLSSGLSLSEEDYSTVW